MVWGAILGGLASGAAGSLLGGGKKAKAAPSPFQQLPTFAQEGFEELVERGRGLAGEEGIFQPIPFLPNEAAALQQLGAGVPLPLKGLGFTKAAQGGISGAQGLLGSISGLVGQGTAGITAPEFQTALSQFQDPFEEGVVQNALRDIREQGQGALSDVAGLATQAGAFGGTRQAELEGDIIGQIARASGDVSGRLRSGGFQFAAQQAANQLAEQRARALTGAGTSAQGAGAFTNLAQTGLAGRAQNIQQAIAQQQAQQQGLLTQAAAGEALRQPLQQQQQIPLQQLQLLQSVLGSVPTAAGSLTQVGGAASPLNTALAGGLSGLSKTITGGGNLSGFQYGLGGTGGIPFGGFAGATGIPFTG